MFHFFAETAVWEALGDVNYAFRICTIVEITGMETDCKANAFSVDITMDTNSGEGRKICNYMTSFMSTQTNAFKGSKWKTKIIYPYSNRFPISKFNLNR